MLGTSNMDNYIIVTDDLGRNYSILAEQKAAFETWHEELFGEALDREDDWIKYLVASECAAEADDSTLPPIEATFSLNTGEGADALIRSWFTKPVVN